MSRLPDPIQVEQFRGIVSRRFGLDLDDTKLGTLADVLKRRVDAGETTFGAFLTHLQSDEAKPELRALASELTVPETYFFRNVDQFRALRELVLPERIRARGDERRFRILSVGCATGEEPYSLAILLREAGLDASWEITITGVDVNPKVLEKAARGRYSSWALRETPRDVQRRWFREDASELVLSDEVRRMVQFQEQNLRDGDRWLAETYDLVLWRNVMMYLTPDCAQSVARRVSRALVPGGYLFLGHAETLRGISNDFHLRHTHDTFYYQRRLATEPREDDSVHSLPIAETRPPPVVTAFESADSWVETIQRASQRIHALTEPASTDAGTLTSLATTWALAVELLEKERFAEALELLRALPPDTARDPNVLLLRAVLLTHGGQLGAAEEACNHLLSVDELDAGAHYLLALCREGQKDRRGAIDHDQVATYLDPSFAMPRLHLGLLARRAGEQAAAQRELGQALILLEREDRGRIVLFGGGFGREALVALCRAELKACGGKT